jgi:hypothetical protein
MRAKRKKYIAMSETLVFGHDSDWRHSAMLFVIAFAALSVRFDERAVPAKTRHLHQFDIPLTQSL